MAREDSELVQLKLNIETSVGESTPTEAKYEVPLSLAEAGVSRLDEDLAEAGQEHNIQGVRWNTEGLVPAVVQDVESRQVLMLAYMNEEALRRTLHEGRAWYYSRSRQSLWRKGETSGHTQKVLEVHFDCDQDAILLTVQQTGMACHENHFSCFHYQAGAEGFQVTGRPEEKPEPDLGQVLLELAEVVRSRHQEMPEGAYTTYLFTKGIDKILKKVGEENAEVIIAAKNNSPDEIRYEVSDLFYHLVVMLEERGVDLKEIARELSQRRR